MSDTLIRSIAKEAGVRVIVAVTTESSQEAARRHRSTPTATTALSRALTAATFAGTLLKVKQRIALKFDGDGPLSKLIAESDAYGRVRGYVENPKVEVARDDNDQIDVASALGSGVLHVSKDLGRDKLIEGVTPLEVSDIGTDFSDYLNKSEQLLSTIQIDVKLDEDGVIEAAGGIMLQSFGDDSGTLFGALSDRLQEMPPIVELLAAGKSGDDVLAIIYGDIPYDTLERRNVEFHCSCSYERSEKAIRMLGREDIEALIEEGEAVVTCHFCHEEYIFTTDDLRVMLASL